MKLTAIWIWGLCVAGSTPTTTPSTHQPPVVRVTATGHPNPRIKGPQQKLMAQRAGEIAALAKLKEKARLSDGTTLRGFRYLAPIYRPDGTVEVTVEWSPSPVASGSGGTISKTKRSVGIATQRTYKSNSPGRDVGGEHSKLRRTKPKP